MSVKPTKFRIVDHGPDHAQYFPGHGISLTEFKECATGCGSTAKEALDDAIEQLATNGWDMSAVEASEDAKIEGTIEGWHDCKTERELETCEHHYYVSVDVTDEEGASND